MDTCWAPRMGQVHLSGQALPHRASPAFHQLCYRGHSFWAGGGGDWSTAGSGQHLLGTSDPKPALPPVASRPDPLSIQKKTFSKGSQQAQATRRHGEGRRDPGTGRGWHSRVAIRSPRGGLCSAVAPGRVSISPSGLGARWGQGAAGSAAGQQRARAGQKQSQASCTQAGVLPGAPGTISKPSAVERGELGAAAEPLRLQSWPACPVASVCPHLVGSMPQAPLPSLQALPIRRQPGPGPGGQHTQADPGRVEREVPAGDPGSCARREVQEGRRCPALGAGHAHTEATPPVALRAGVHSPRFSSKEPEGKTLVNALRCQLSLKLVCRQPG